MWTISEKGFDVKKIAHYGNQFLIGHLNLGIRGTLEEFEKEDKVAIHLPMIYDQVGDGWREPVNAFNPLYTRLYVEGKPLDIKTTKIISHTQELSIFDGVMKRITVYDLEDGQIEIVSSRFVDMTGKRSIYHRYEVKSSINQRVVLETGIDTDIWDLHGPHLEEIKGTHDPYLKVSGYTHQDRHEISVLKCVVSSHDLQKEVIRKDHKLLESYQIDAKKGERYMFTTYAYIGVNEHEEDLYQNITDMMRTGYEEAYQLNQKIWYNLWQDADVIIEGDIAAQLALRYSIYHLLILAPRHSKNQSIPARGISGQTYKGAIFWDTEIFMLPFYLNTDLGSAKSILNYRIHGLKGAKDKALSYGYKGAFYAWESQEDGYDACTDYNVTDVFTNRLVRTYFKDKQIHISGDVVYAIISYMNRTKDEQILKDGALEVILEVARFYLDYGHYAILRDRFEVKDVLGPDEYHERVANNAFTNRLIKMVFETVIYYETWFRERRDKYFYDLVKKIHFEEELTQIHQYHEKVYIKAPNDEGIIEQFDDYFKLRDIKKEELLLKRLHPNEYLGGSGLAGDTKIIKQADVITMLHLFDQDYDLDVLKANFDFYEPKTEHGSSLSASMYALIACKIDKPEYAYPLFMKSATVDLTGDSKHYAGGIYIGGTHPAASGGAYMTAIYGFAGLKIGDDMTVSPNLPKAFKSMSFKVKHRDKRYQIYVSHQTTEIKEI